MAQLIHNKSYKLQGFENSIEETLENLIKNDKISEYFIIVPTRKSSNFLKNKLVRDYYSKYAKPLKDPNILNLEEFVSYIFEQLPRFKEYQRITGAYQIAVFEKAIKSLDLIYYKKLTDNLINEIFTMIFGIREDSAEFISKESGATELENYKLKDLKNIFQAYNEALKTDKLLDTPAVLNLVNETLIEYNLNNPYSLLDEIFAENIKILTFGFSEFKAPEFNLISQFGNSNVQFGMNIDYSTENGPIFGNLYESIKLLLNNEFSSVDLVKDEEYITKNNPNPKEIRKTTFLRRWLFNDDFLGKTDAFNENIEIFRCEDKKSEIEFVAKKIKDLVNSGVNYSEIAVCFRQPELYSGRVRDIFTQHRIPSFISDRYNLAGSNLVASIFSLIDIVLNNYQKSDLQKALNSRFIEFPKDKSNEKINAENLIQFANKERLVHSSSQKSYRLWQNTIERKKKNIELNLTELETDSIDYYNLNKELINIRKVERDLNIIQSALNFQNDNFTPKELEILFKKDIIEKFKIREQIINFNKEIIANEFQSHFESLTIKENLEKDARALIAFIEVLDEILTVEEKLRPGEKIRLSEFISKLKIAVTGKKYNVKQKENFGVWVTASEQLRSIPYKYTFLCGLIDGEFPLAYNPKKALGIDLPNTKKRHEESDRMNFFQFLTNNPDELNFGKKKIYLTFPRSSNQELLVRSQFVDAIIRKTNLEIQEVPIHYKQMITSEFEISRYYEDIKSNDIESFVPNLKKPEFANCSNKLEKNEPNLDIENDVIIQEINTYLQKSISPSALENYSSCNYRMMLSYLLKVSKLDEEQEEVDEKDLGSLMHTILYEFFNQIRDRNGIMPDGYPNELFEYRPICLQPNDENIEFYQNLLIEITKKYVEESFITGVNKHELLNMLLGLNYADKNYDTKKGVLLKWLDNEIENSKTSDYKPAFFELSFGEKSKFYPEITQLNGENNRSLKIKGKIDRIDVKLQEGNMSFKVIDYKTSSSKEVTYPKIIKGDIFQLPIYSLAFQDSMLKKTGIIPEIKDLSYFILKPKKNEYTKDLTKDIANTRQNKEKTEIAESGKLKDLNIETIIDVNLELALTHLDNMKLGFFRANPQKDACKYCDYKNICRIKENS